LAQHGSSSFVDVAARSGVITGPLARMAAPASLLIIGELRAVVHRGALGITARLELGEPQHRAGSETMPWQGRNTWLGATRGWVPGSCQGGPWPPLPGHTSGVQSSSRTLDCASDSLTASTPPPPQTTPASWWQLGLMVLATCAVWRAAKGDAAAQRGTRARCRSHTPHSPVQRTKP
jgi:hypothetical protein